MADRLDLRGIAKRFGQVQALCGVDFSIRAGEIHALVGENGAGKSTLLRIAFGLAQPDAGSIDIMGARRVLHSPADARQLGIGMVHQHFTSVPAFSVAENVALAAGWRYRPREVAARVDALARRFGLALHPAANTGDLPATSRQRLELIKALAADPHTLLLDEPTSVLPPGEVESFLAQLEIFKSQGLGCALITHKLDEALRIADRVTVLRRGEVVLSAERSGVTSAALAMAMLGEAPLESPHRRRGAPGEVVVRLEAAALPRLGPSGAGLRSGTLSIRAGEVVGVAAVEGNGERELLRLAAGIVRPTHGLAEIRGRVVFIPEDRSTDGLIGEFSIGEHFALAQGSEGPWVRRGLIRWAEANRRAGELIAAHDVRAPGPMTPMRELSGGNQQRVVLAAALEQHPAVLVAENPTRGLDLRATRLLLRRLREASCDGVAVLVYLPDLDELLEVADRVVVVVNGEVVTLTEDAGRQEIGARMLGRGGNG